MATPLDKIVAGFSGHQTLTIQAVANGQEIALPEGGISLSPLGSAAGQILPASISSQISSSFLAFGTNALKLEDAYLTVARVDTLAATTAQPAPVSTCSLTFRWENTSWDLISGLLSVQDPQIEAQIADSDTTARTAIYISGALTFGGIPLDVSVVIPDMNVSAALPSETDSNGQPVAQSYPLSPLLNEFGITSSLLDNVSLDRFRLSASVLSRVFSLDIGIGEKLAIQLPGGISLELDNVGLNVSHIGGTPSYNSFAIAGQFVADSTTYDVSVGHSTGGGVSIYGRADFTANPVAPSAVLDSLCAKLGLPAEIKVPDAISSFTITALSFTYDSPNEAFSFAVGKWDLGSKWAFLGSGKFVLDSLSFSADFAGTTLNSLSLSAFLDIGGVGLSAKGSYSSGQDWQISASMIQGDSVDVTALLTGLVDAFDTASLPEFLQGISVSNVAITLEPQAGIWSATGDMTIALANNQGSVNAVLSVDHDSSGATPVTRWSIDLSLSGKAQDCIADVCGLLSDFGLPSIDAIKPPLEFEIVAVGITHDGQSWSGHCSGAMTIEEDGTSIKFDIQFTDSTNSDQFNLTLAGLVFKGQTATNGPSVLSLTGPQTIHLSDISKLLRLQALEDPGFDPSITINGAFLASMPAVTGTSPQPAKKLFGLEFGLNATLPDNAIVDFVTGGSTVGMTGATLFAASASWSATELAGISGQLSGFQFPPVVSKGPSFAATITAGSTTVFAPLCPSGQQPQAPASSGSGTGGAPTQSSPVPTAVTSPSAARWFDVQKQAGPVYLDRAAFALGHTGSGGTKVDLLCDASFTLGPIKIALDGFSFEFPLKLGFVPSDIEVSLQGLSLSYNKPPLAISGGFLHTTDQAGDDIYAGEASIQTEALFLSAIGEYAKDAQGNTSLALFAVLNNPPLGGPVFCFVTGLAAGFGYNSKLNIPATASDVANFALVQAASPPAPGASAPDPMTMIASCVTPAGGEDWLAVGLLFQSFELLQSTALLTVAFGHDLQFAVLGQSELSIPPNSPDRLAYAQVDIEATYSPSAGALEVFGVLTPNSFVLSPDCHLTGGFAYILKESGDFVATFGGYHPAFDYASHGYPAVPRLQMLWQVDDHTCIKGTEYFALTPGAMMAGGSLEATWSCGIFSAWFNVDVDLLMQWKPFHYEADFSMSLGVSFDLHIWFVHIHFTFHVGASLHAEGPPFHGTAHIDLDVVSFDVSFGPSAGPLPQLTWPEFRNMLPGDPTDDAAKSALLSAKVTDGLVRDLSQSKPAGSTDPDWVVNGTHFCFEVRTSLPVTAASAGNGVSVTLAPSATAQIGILPMGVESATGTLSLDITDENNQPVRPPAGSTSAFVVEPLAVDMAPAHWGTQPPGSPNVAPLSVTGGYRISGVRPDPARTVPVLVSTLLATPCIVTSISDRVASARPFGG